MYVTYCTRSNFIRFMQLAYSLQGVLYMKILQAFLIIFDRVFDVKKSTNVSIELQVFKLFFSTVEAVSSALIPS